MTEFYAFKNGWSLFIDFENGCGFCKAYVFNAESALVEEADIFTQEIPEWIDSVESVGTHLWLKVQEEL